MKLKCFPLLVFLLFLCVLTGDVLAAPKDFVSSTVSAYRYYREADIFSIQTPRVVEIPFSNEFIDRFDFAVLDTTINVFEPYFFRQETLINETPMTVSAIPETLGITKIIDRNDTTYTEFSLPGNTQGRAEVILESVFPVTSSAFTLFLQQNVALPTSVEVRAFIGNQEKIIFANSRMSEQNVRFPQTTSNKWRIIFTYAQPLYISELRLIEDNAIKSNTHAIRFLAQPNHSYRIYYNPDRTTSPPLKEAGNLAFAQDVLVLNTTSQVSNPDYVVADSDTDGVPDTFDNCISMANIDQKDINKNGRGDVCDDFDEDGIVNTKDNCPDNPNRDQQDVDADGIGDTCDTEESRITERHAWIPWAGIGFAAIVLIVLLAVTAKSVYRERNGGV